MKLKEWADEQAEECFVAEYINTDDPAQKEKNRAEAIGIRISQMLNWEGERIGLFALRVLTAALEDANWHDVAAIVYDMTEKMENGASIGNVFGIDELEEVEDH